MAKTGKRRSRDEEVQEFEKPQPKKGKPLHMQEQLDGNEDGEEEDPGNWESQEFLKVTKFLENQQAAARSNHHVAEFQKVIENRKVELKKVLQDKTREIHELDAQLRRGFISALRESLVGEDQENVELAGQALGQLPIPHPIFRRATALISSAKDLLQFYSSLSQQVASSEARLACDQNWHGNSTKLQEIITEQGKRVEMQVYRRLVERMEKHGEGNEDGPPPVREHAVWSHFGATTAEGKGENDKAGEAAWGKAAKYAKRGVKRLVNHLPEDD